MRTSARVGALVALALWVGGLAALTLIAAPLTFRHAPSHEAAGTIFGAILRTFNHVEMACGVIALACALLARPRGRAQMTRVALIGAMLVVVGLVGLWLIPTMGAIRQLEPERFQSLHRLSEMLYGGNLVAGLIALGLSGIERRHEPVSDLSRTGTL
jgi:uncharacterized membrane protein